MIFTVDDVASAREILLDFHNGIGDYINGCGNLPVAGSPAIGEVAAWPDVEDVRTVYGQVAMLVETAGDQITGFVKLVTEPVETMAPWSTVRACLEASALGCWLLDPAIDVKERVGRSIALRFEGLLQQRKWAVSADHPVDHVNSRIDEMIIEAEPYNILPIRAGNRVLGLGRQMPAATEMIRDYLNEEAMYRLLSAVAHGHHWAVSTLAFRLAGDRPDPEGYRAMEKAPLLSGIMYLARGAGAAFSLLVQRETRYCGWPTETLASLHMQMANRFDAITEAAAARQ